MCLVRAVLVAVFLLVLEGCSGEPVHNAAEVVVEDWEGQSLDRVSRVARLRISGLVGVPVENVWLIAGEVSDASLSRLRRGDVPKTVDEARVPAATWLDGGTLYLAPTQILDAETSYTLVAPGAGALGWFSTSAEEPALWHRWGHGTVSVGSLLIYCSHAPPWAVAHLGELATSDSDSAGAEGHASVVVFPARTQVFLEIESDWALGGSCISFRVPEDAGPRILLPPRLGEFFFEPSPVLVGEPPDGEPPAQPPLAESVFSVGGVVGVSLLAGTHFAQLFCVDEQGVSELVRRVAWQTTEGGRLSLGAAPSGCAKLGVRLASLTRAGSLGVEQVELEPSSTGGFPVLNEVLANPVGPEPASEWVEIFNAGTGVLQLSDYRLADTGATLRLPSLEVGPGEYGIIVSRDYVADAALDVVPSRAAVPVVVEQLGKSGLLNSGELLRLLDDADQVVSMVPAVAADAGVSVARRNPAAPDEETSFCHHDAPGASPGAPNLVQD